MEDKEVLIEAKHLVKSYGVGEGLTYALNDVSMKVYKGEFLVILGYSGSGKSTFLNMIGGIDKVDSGEIVYKGEDITKFKDRKLTAYRKDTIGYIFQFFNLLNELTVLQNISLAPGSEKDKAKIGEILEMVGLGDKKDKFPRQLSGGQQQRVSIARALAKKSEMILCDEPTGALDYSSGKDVLRCLEKIHDQGKTIVMVTHTKEIAGMADRVVTMKNGKVVDERINEHKVSADEVDW